METIGERIERLREACGWSRPDLGKLMATVIGREKPFTGELVRLYEEGENRPGADARMALALVFNITESEIEFGKQDIARQPTAEYRSISERAIDVAKRFDQLSPECQEHVSHQIDLLKAASRGNGERDRAAQQDVVIKNGEVVVKTGADQSSAAGKKRRRS